MILRFSFLAIIIQASCITSCIANVHVKVLLSSTPIQEVTELKLFSENGVTVKSLQEQNRQKIFESQVSIEIKNSEIYINKKKLLSDKSLIIEPASEHILLNDKPYHGSIRLTIFKDNLCVINKVHLEDYVYSVLKTESWMSWSTEMQKVMAIACRSYALNKILEAKKQSLPYDIKSSNFHQTYTGVHKQKHLKVAVSETAGIIMSYNKKPVLAMFDTCCGGIVPADIKSLNHRDAPYLGRKYACTHCKDLKVFSWNLEFEKHNLLDILKQRFSGLKNISDIKIVKRDKAGLVTEILVRDGKKRYLLEGKKLYSLVKEIKSYFFDINYVDSKFKISGKGFGHHIGLCQWGANEMIKKGSTYKETLVFYYPGVKFSRIAMTQ